MSIEITAKKVEDAIKQGLEQLGVGLDEVKVEVLESGGLLRKAKVRLTLDKEEEPAPAEKPAEKPVEKKEVKPEQKPAEKKADKPAAKPEKKADKPVEKKADKPVEKKAEKSEQKPREVKPDEAKALKGALDFVAETVKLMGFDGVKVTADEADAGNISIDAPAGDDSLIIGRHGETLSSIQYLAETAARAEKCKVNITVDCNGYRDRRAASIAAMARRRANECAAKHRRIKLEPMDRHDRRTVHFALSDDDRVTTSSEGKEPHRCVVIFPKNDRRPQKQDRKTEEAAEEK